MDEASWVGLARGWWLWGAAEADAEEDFEDAGGGFEGGLEVAGYFGLAADAAAVVDGKLEDAEAVLGGFDLHFKVPAVGELGHAERVKEERRMARKAPMSV